MKMKSGGLKSRHILAVAASALFVAAPVFAAQGQGGQAPRAAASAQSGITGYGAFAQPAPLAQQAYPGLPQSYATSVGYPAYGAYGPQFAVPQGYAQPGYAPQGYAPQSYAPQVSAPQATGPQPGTAQPGFDPYAYPLPANATTFQGYALPGATSAPFYGAPDFYGFPGQPVPDYYGFAPAEPIYAPAERLGGAGATAATAEPTPIAPASSGNYVSIDAPEAEDASTGYSVEIAPSTGETYVGTSTQIAPASSYQGAADPYAVITQEQAQPAQPVYQPYQSNYEAYQGATAVPAPAPAYEAYQAAPAPAPNYEVYQSAPAPVAAPAPARYEYETVVAPQPIPEPIGIAPVPGYETGIPAAGHYVQVAAFRKPELAQRLLDKLRAAGELAFVVPANVRGTLYHRVRIPAGNRRDARYVRDRVRNLGYYEARVVKG